jgi:undecaprenyl-diphosphatase
MEFIELLKSVVIGIVQGITEWLPVSSTGHMILLDEFIRLNVTDEFMEMFRVVIQLGSIFAVLLLYFDRLNPLSANKTPDEKQNVLLLWLKVVVAVIPAAVIGFLFDEKIDELFFNYRVVAVTLILYGILFLIVENRKRKSEITSLDKLDFKTALMIGGFQVLSLIPGTSRSGATILGAILLGTSRKTAAEFSFFLAIPVMFGASFLKLVKFGFNLSGNEWSVLITGFITAFAVSVFAIKFLMNFIKNRDFKPFGYYRIILGIIVLAYFVFS